jgi:hypothetical protein
MKVERQFALFFEWAGVAETDRTVHSVLRCFKKDNALMERPMQQVFRHRGMKTLVVMQEASRALSYREAADEIVANQKLEAKPGFRSMKIRECG